MKTPVSECLIFNKVPGLRPPTLCKKETPTQVISCSFCEIFKNTFGQLLLSFKGTTDCLYPRILYDIEGSVT